MPPHHHCKTVTRVEMMGFGIVADRNPRREQPLEPPVARRCVMPSELPPVISARLAKRTPGDLLPLLATFLEEVMSLGCIPAIPPARTDTYINVQPPRGHRSGRICAITLGTVRVEFQADSFDCAQSLNLEDKFDLVPVGAKAAISLRSQSDVDAATAVARALVAARAS